MEQSPSSIRCGCGFEVIGPDTEHNAAMYEAHECSTNDSVWESIFSFSGVMIVAILTSVAFAIVRLLVGAP